MRNGNFATTIARIKTQGVSAYRCGARGARHVMPRLQSDRPLEMSDGICPPPARRFEVDIGPDQLERYANDGFLVIERITSDEELEWLRGVYDALLAMPATGYLDGIFDLSRPYGSTAQPQLGQLLLPRTFRHAHSGNVVLAERAPHFIAAAGAAGAETRKLVPSDLQRGQQSRPKRRGTRTKRIGTSTKNSMRLRRGSRSTTSIRTTVASGTCPVHTAATSKRIGTVAMIRRCTYSNSTNRPTRAALCRFGSRPAA